ncbi:MAG: hypothetical protein IJX53_00675 [Clostridia bacterium]|nr:hypothetical protein [Clostridia bacterium]
MAYEISVINIAAEARRRLGTDAGDDARQPLERLTKQYLDAALAYCNADDADPAMDAIVCEAVMAAWLRGGDEGVSASSAGGQSATYSDQWNDMFTRLRRAGLRRWRT